MKKFLLTLLGSLLFSSLVYADRPAINWSTPATVTVNTTVATITAPYNCTLWFDTTTDVYYALKSTATPNTTTGFILKADGNIDLNPLLFTSSDSVSFVTTSATGYVHYVWYEMNDD